MLLGIILRPNAYHEMYLLASWALVIPYLCDLQVFIVDVKSSKKQIKDAVQSLYDIQTKKINTLIRCGGNRWC